MKITATRFCFVVFIAAFVSWMGAYGSLRFFCSPPSQFEALILDEDIHASRGIDAGFLNSSLAVIFLPLTEIDEKLSGSKVVFDDWSFHIGNTAEF